MTVKSNDRPGLPPVAAGAHVNAEDALGGQLKEMFDSVSEGPLPDRLMALLDQLDDDIDAAAQNPVEDQPKVGL